MPNNAVIDSTQMPPRSRSGLVAIRRALGREAHAIVQRPDLLWPQLYNHLQWESPAVRALLDTQHRRRLATGARPWLRSRAPFRTSGALLRTLHHGGPIRLCAFSPDQQWIVSAGFDASPKVWSLETGELAATLVGHAGPVLQVAFDRSGRRLATGDSAGQLAIWEVPAGVLDASLVAENTDHTVSSLAFSPDARRLVFARGRTVQITDARNLRILASLDGHHATVRACAYSADGSRLASGDDDGTLRIWETATWTETTALASDAGCLACTFHGNGAQLLSAGALGLKRVIRIWDVESGQTLHVVTGHHAVYSADGTRIAVASQKRITIVDLHNFRESILDGHLGVVNDCAFNPSATRVVSASDDGTLKLWDAADGKEIATLAGHGAGISGGVTVCVFQQDGTRIVSSGSDGTVRVWDAALAEAGAPPPSHRGRVNTCAFSNDGERVVSSSWDDTLRIWNPQSAESVATLAGHRHRIYACAFSPDGSIIASAGGDRLLKIWNADTGVERLTREAHQDATLTVEDCRFDPSGPRVLSVGFGTLTLWDATTGNQLARWSGGPPAAISPDGARIAFTERTRIVKIRDRDSATVAVCGGHEDKVTDLAFSPDGRRLISASDDKTLRLWDAVACAPLATLAHPAWVTRGAFSPDGRRIVSATARMIHIWDAESLEQIAVCRGHRDAITAYVISPGGTRVISASEDRSVRVWDLGSGAELTAVLLSSPLYCLAHHPFELRLATGDDAGSLTWLEARDLGPEPPVVTPVDWGRGPEIACAKCRRRFAARVRLPDATAICPSSECALEMKINDFVLRAHGSRSGIARRLSPAWSLLRDLIRSRNRTRRREPR